MRLWAIPTAGLAKNELGIIEPDESGRKRIDCAIEYLANNNSSCIIAFIGFYGFARYYYYYLERVYPQYKNIIVINRNHSAITNRDYRESAVFIDSHSDTNRDHTVLHIPSHPNHLWIINRVLRKLGYRAGF